ncbi:MAG: HU family DNA-binding protein [Methylophaga sp.]|nr:HU family DNA-binding protein [Methylophaga sp.]
MKRYLLTIILFVFTSTVLAQSDRGLAKLIAADLSMDEEQVFQVIKSFKHHTIEALREGKVVRLQGLGQFYAEHEAARPNGNPRTGESRPIPAKNYLRFKASKVGNQSLN